METLDDYACSYLPNNVKKISWKLAKRFVESHHYLGYTPARHRFTLGVYFDNELIGIMMFGRPVARYEDQDTTLELTRMVLLPSPKNSESRSLSLAEKYIKKNTEFRRLIAYADSDRHQGTIYRAANWKEINRHHQTGRWNFRKGRKRNAGGDKIKFERNLK